MNVNANDLIFLIGEQAVTIAGLRTQLQAALARVKELEAPKEPAE